MKRLLVILFSLASCAAIRPYDDSAACPSPMTDEMRLSGVVRCRAMCSSEGRNFSSFDDDCKCRCARGYGGGYLPR